MDTVNYPYTEQLERLARTSAPSGTSYILPSSLCDIVSPINILFWREQLEHQQDNRFRHLILQGLENDFSIGLNRACQLKPANHNLIDISYCSYTQK